MSKESILRKVTHTITYSLIRSLIITMDAFLVMAELQYSSLRARDSEYRNGIPDPVFFLVFADMFCIILLLDMMLQFVLEFPHVDLWKGRTGYRWFNLLVIVEQILELIAHHSFKGGRSTSTFRIAVAQLSVLRVVRPIVVLPEIAAKIQAPITELRVMIRSLTGALQPLILCCLPFMFIIANFAVFVCEGTIVYLVQNGNNSPEMQELEDSFGSLTSSMLSLYKAILGGMDWGDLYNAMMPLSWYLKAAFLCFICFNFIAMLNIVAAVFIRTAFVRSENDRHFMIQKEIDAKQNYLETMRDVFAELDEDKDGKIFFEELEGHLHKPEVGAYFSKLGVDVNEVGKLFLLLDEDGSGCIDMDEFMFGCLRLKGEAKSLDLAILHREVQTVSQQMDDVLQACSDRVALPMQPLGSNSPGSKAAHLDMAVLRILRQDIRVLTDDMKRLRDQVSLLVTASSTGEAFRITNV